MSSCNLCLQENIYCFMGPVKAPLHGFLRTRGNIKGPTVLSLLPGSNALKCAQKKVFDFLTLVCQTGGVSVSLYRFFKFNYSFKKNVEISDSEFLSVTFGADAPPGWG